MELRLWIPVASGIPDSLSCFPDCKAKGADTRVTLNPMPWIPDSRYWIPVFVSGT